MHELILTVEKTLVTWYRAKKEKPISQTGTSMYFWRVCISGPAISGLPLQLCLKKTNEFSTKAAVSESETNSTKLSWAYAINILLSKLEFNYVSFEAQVYQSIFYCLGWTGGESNPGMRIRRVQSKQDWDQFTIFLTLCSKHGHEL